MKTKIILMLLFFASIAYEASAFIIIIRGGGTNHMYYQVIVTNRKISCTGTGHNTCPVGWTVAQTHATPTWHPLGVLTDYVLDQVANGRTSGETNFDNELPVTWKMADDENVEINIDDNAIKEIRTNENDSKR